MSASVFPCLSLSVSVSLIVFVERSALWDLFPDHRAIVWLIQHAFDDGFDQAGSARLQQSLIPLIFFSLSLCLSLSPPIEPAVRVVLRSRRSLIWKFALDSGSVQPRGRVAIPEAELAGIFIVSGAEVATSFFLFGTRRRAHARIVFVFPRRKRNFLFWKIRKPGIEGIHSRTRSNFPFAQTSP